MSIFVFFNQCNVSIKLEDFNKMYWRDVIETYRILLEQELIKYNAMEKIRNGIAR